MTALQGFFESKTVPQWVPDAARNYLAHTETGLSIRAVARACDCHPSTVLRQVRRFEGRRDDPLIDAALKSLSALGAYRCADDKMDKETMDIDCWKADPSNQAAGLTQSRIDQDAKRILRRLCEQGAVLAVAREMETSVVVRSAADGSQLRTAVVDREIAQAMALKEWITCPDPEGRISRYFITNTGRAALRRLTAEDENRAHGFADKRAKANDDADWDIEEIAGTPAPAARYHTTESPLVGLARRRDREGEFFLARNLVSTGERLREDYELAQLSATPIDNWTDFMTEDALVDAADSSPGAAAAQARVKAALADLGPGLGDVVLRCCCFLEGLEQTEKKLGWSARSGKIVLRIALQRLMRHYEDTQGQYGPMIG